MIILKDGRAEEWLISNLEVIAPGSEVYSAKKVSWNNFLARFRLIRILLQHYYYLKVAIKGLKTVEDSDTLVCLLDVIGVYGFLLSKIFRKKVRFLLVNIMVNCDRSVITRAKRLCYKKLLSSKKVFCTINTGDLVKYYSEEFGINFNKYYKVKDGFTRYSFLMDVETKDEGFVFVGGVNARDWGLVKKVALSTPECKFVVVARELSGLFDGIKNVTVFKNLKIDEFLDLLSSAAVCWIPLKTEAPAGLIVMLQAALLRKPLLATANVVTRSYIDNESDGYLHQVGNANESKQLIKSLCNQPLLRRNLASKMYSRVIAENTPQKFVQNIVDVYYDTLK